LPLGSGINELSAQSACSPVDIPEASRLRSSHSGRLKLKRVFGKRPDQYYYALHRPQINTSLPEVDVHTVPPVPIPDPNGRGKNRISLITILSR